MDEMNGEAEQGTSKFRRREQKEKEVTPRSVSPLFPAHPNKTKKEENPTDSSSGGLVGKLLGTK